MILNLSQLNEKGNLKYWETMKTDIGVCVCVYERVSGGHRSTLGTGSLAFS